MKVYLKKGETITIIPEPIPQIRICNWIVEHSGTSGLVVKEVFNDR